jgi:hypothetical protein
MGNAASSWDVFRVTVTRSRKTSPPKNLTIPAATVGSLMTRSVMFVTAVPHEEVDPGPSKPGGPPP